MPIQPIVDWALRRPHLAAAEAEVINHFAAVHTVRQVNKPHLDSIGKRYRIDLHIELASTLRATFARYLTRCVADSEISDDEVASLIYLKDLLDLTNEEARELHDDTVAQRYSAVVADCSRVRRSATRTGVPRYALRAAAAIHGPCRRRDDRACRGCSDFKRRARPGRRDSAHSTRPAPECGMARRREWRSTRRTFLAPIVTRPPRRTAPRRGRSPAASQRRRAPGGRASAAAGGATAAERSSGRQPRRRDSGTS